MEGRGIKQDLIPYLGQLEFANDPIQGWIIDPDVYGLLDGPCDVVHLPTHYEEVINPDVMTCGVSMVIDGEKSPEMFPKPFLIGPCRFPYVLLIILRSVTLVPVDYSTFQCDVFPVLWGHQEIPDGAASLDMDLDPHFATNVLETFA